VRQLQFEAVGRIRGTYEAEHPDRAGQHVCGPHGLASEVRVETAGGKGRYRTFDQVDSIVDPVALTLPDRAQRVDGPRGDFLAMT